MKKKGLVFDKQRYFSRFLKHVFGKALPLDSYVEFKKFDDDLGNYSFFVFVIYSEEDFENLIEMYKKGVPLVVYTFNTTFFYKIKKYKQIQLFDISKTKSEIRKEMENYFSQVHKIICDSPTSASLAISHNELYMQKELTN